mgnify:CR=1 FL=1
MTDTTLEEQPATKRKGLSSMLLADLRKPVTDDKAREVLFGATQYQRR